MHSPSQSDVNVQFEQSPKGPKLKSNFFKGRLMSQSVIENNNNIQVGEV